jgi:NADPH-dependent 2,4-dienoyl-CoA reductase/sulfur reductase-like enzyme
MTGPEYADYYITAAESSGIQTMTETMVLRMSNRLKILAVNRKGLYGIRAKAVVLATGCREKTRWSAMIPGDRPSGIYTAGLAQALINLYNIMPGENVIILGSGDVGLIMARRLTLEGAHVVGVVEMLPYASGLPRNAVQCLEDFNIPLFLNHTILSIHGQERLEGVTITKVDKRKVPISGTERLISCDTLLLSLGLIPENEIASQTGIKIDSATGGPSVDQQFETTLRGVFACGNCLQVYDTVDALSADAKEAGVSAAQHATRSIKKNGVRKKKRSAAVHVAPGPGIRYVVPQRVTCDGRVQLTLRASKSSDSSILRVNAEGDAIVKKKLRWVNPVNMIKVVVDIPAKFTRETERWEVSLDDD